MTDTKGKKTSEIISGKLARALDLMTWGDQTGKPMPWEEAARTVGISARSMRRSLERAIVRKYLMDQKQVLRDCLSARNLFHLDELVSQRQNMGAAVQAARAIEGLVDGEPHAPGRQQMPGLVVQINVPTLQAQRPAIDVTPDPHLPRPANSSAFGPHLAPYDSHLLPKRG